MKKGFIIFLIVGVILLWVLNKVNTARQIEFTIGVPKQFQLTGSSLSFDLPMLAQNISSGSIRVNSADFDVISAGKFLGKALITSPTTITPNGTTTLPVRVTIGYLDLLAAATSIFNLFKSGTVGITIDGLVYAEGFQVPVKQSIDIPIPKF